MLVSGPIHPYEMQRRMKLWGKGEVVNLSQRASLYRTIERLTDVGLIEVRGTERDQRFPERTVYELTEAGLHSAREWLTEMLANPRNEFPQFPAALSFIMGLNPDEARGVLEQRASVLRPRLSALAHEMAEAERMGVPRVTLLDADYLRASMAGELAWLDGVIAQLRDGTLSWSAEELAESARRFLAQ
ncbi:MAG: PadR family transcriptional regulator [Chloroflexi bacterium]|nr:PadR family transcriptional regulator [Chloroflexota bacterium]